MRLSIFVHLLEYTESVKKAVRPQDIGLKTSCEQHGQSENMVD